MFRVYPERDLKNWKKEITKIYKGGVSNTYLSIYTDIKSIMMLKNLYEMFELMIVKGFNPETGKPRDYKEIIDWPLIKPKKVQKGAII